MTNAEIVQLLKDNLADPRLFAVKLFLEGLITREVSGDGIEENRIYTLTPSLVPGEEPTKTYVTSLTDFLSKLDADEVTPEYMFGSFKADGKSTPPFSVTVDNLIVELDHNSDEDDTYFRYWGGSTVKKQISFILSYVNDNDKELPIKIANVTLG